MTDHLRRTLAPASDAAWDQIDEEAARTLSHHLAARAVVDVRGPQGWEYSAVPTGRIRTAAEPSSETGVVTAVRDVIPTLELRTPFALSLDGLDAADRGGDIDLDVLIEAARSHALAEDQAIFYGSAGNGASGIIQASPHEPIIISENYEEYPSYVARAVAILKGAGIRGPYALCLGPRCYTGVIETTEHGGYPLLEHLKLIVGGPVIWAPAVEGAVVVSRRGGDYELSLGDDISIGYRGHTVEEIELYLQESFTFLVRESRAAVALHHPARRGRAVSKGT